MEHTFLVQEGLWEATGKYYDEDSNTVQAEGKNRIEHQRDKWINKGTMKLLLDEPVEFTNIYEIKPLKQGEEYTKFISNNPDLGEFQGKFIFIEDIIISESSTADNEYTTYECLRKIDDNTYTSKGIAFKGDNKLSSWSVELKRLE
jgi:hypothetical protein